MSPPAITLTARQRDLILNEAAAAYPAECCGLLVGRGGGADGWTVSRVVPAANVAATGLGHSNRDRFEVDPQVRFDLERALRGGAEQVIGHYHSHPDHPAKPSATDLAKAYEPSLIWIIAGAQGGDATSLGAFRLDGGDFETLALEILDGDLSDD
ncbi:MAG: M67 family metallopeptidase [Rhodospirillales bacterium]|jgi:proteasome lid subunit RPN8/RPN11